MFGPNGFHRRREISGKGGTVADPRGRQVLAQAPAPGRKGCQVARELHGQVLVTAAVGGNQVVEPDGAPDHKERQRRAQRGAELLDRLEEIRRGLLTGAIPKDRLAQLAQMMREKRERGADPMISRLLDEIELRAEVELAKLSRRIA